jgi:hypothetical protein
MIYELYALLSAIGLFVGMLILLEIGRGIRCRRLKQDGAGDPAGIGAVETAVFGLFGLLIAFTFSGAASRFDIRRGLIVEEINAIGTAYLRVDLLPAGAQPAVRETFRHYLEARLEAYQKLPDLVAAKQELAKANQLQAEIWRQAITGSRSVEAHPDAAKLLLPALNQMIDLTTTRTMAAETHPPRIIFAMLFGLALASALLAGYGMAGGVRRSWLHNLSFALAVVITIYVILDIEYPRLGLIRVDAFDQALMELRQSMK